MEYKNSILTRTLIGAAMEVHKILGNGFQEVIYQRAYFVELLSRDCRVVREFEMPISYKGVPVGSRRVDFLCNEAISIEIKAIVELEDMHLAQALNYLEAYNLEIGLLINFGSRSLEFHRLFNKKYTSQNPLPSNKPKDQLE